MWHCYFLLYEKKLYLTADTNLICCALSPLTLKTNVSQDLHCHLWFEIFVLKDKQSEILSGKNCNFSTLHPVFLGRSVIFIGSRVFTALVS